MSSCFLKEAMQGQVEIRRVTGRAERVTDVEINLHFLPG